MLKNQLREIRTTKGKDGKIDSLRYLSQELKINRRYLAELDNKQATIFDVEKLQVICNHYNIPMSELIQVED